jgi:arylsulfatase A-like enzyme
LPGLLTCLVVVATAIAGCERGSRPHIFLITSDTLRADHLSINGYSRWTSPSIDRFARDAWRFTGAITVIPKTAPSFATIFSGLHPRAHGVEFNRQRVPEGAEMLAETLQKRGYRTAAFVSNPAVSADRGFARGFTRYESFPPVDGVARSTEAFIRWAEQEDWDHPTFLWLHWIDPHGPYEPPPPFADLFRADELSTSEDRVPLVGKAGKFGPNKILGAIPEYQRLGDENRVALYVARYDAEIRYIDDAFGRVVRFLTDRHLYDGSAIVFTSDHGESLGEHDYYFEHGWYAYDPTLRIPLMIKVPGQTEGSKVEDLVSTLDLRPTILRLARIRSDEVGPGRDLFERPREYPPVLVQNAGRYPHRYLGVRTERYKYLRDEASGDEEIYDLAADPAETRNLAGDRPDLVEQMRKQLRSLVASSARGSLGTASTSDLDARTREQLESLGYTE